MLKKVIGETVSSTGKKDYRTIDMFDIQEDEGTNQTNFDKNLKKALDFDPKENNK